MTAHNENEGFGCKEEDEAGRASEINKNLTRAILQKERTICVWAPRVVGILGSRVLRERFWQSKNIMIESESHQDIVCAVQTHFYFTLQTILHRMKSSLVEYLQGIVGRFLME